MDNKAIYHSILPVLQLYAFDMKNGLQGASCAGISEFDLSTGQQPTSTLHSYIFLFYDWKIGYPGQERRMEDLLARAQGLLAGAQPFLVEYYPWTKALHVISVIAWMAGLFYLPRLFVYHAQKFGKPMAATFEIMERRLLRAIMNPAMVGTWVFGLALVSTPYVVDWSAHWVWPKAASVLAMTWFHHWLGRRRKELAAGNCSRTARQFRMMNEVPTVLMMIIVISVIVKF